MMDALNIGNRVCSGQATTDLVTKSWRLVVSPPAPPVTTTMSWHPNATALPFKMPSPRGFQRLELCL